MAVGPPPHSPESETRKKQKMDQHEQQSGGGSMTIADDDAGAANGRSSPMHISTPAHVDMSVAAEGDTGDEVPRPPPPLRSLQDSDPIRVHIAVDVDGAPEDVRTGLRQITGSHNVGYFWREGEPAAEFVWRLRFEHVDAGLEAGSYDVRAEEVNAFVVRYRRTIDAFRALGQVLTAARTAESVAQQTGSDAALSSAQLSIGETAQFETLALMIDCSRNGVVTVESVFAMLRNMALMGYTMLQLYTEDTYRVADEPFFGYLRGGYTQVELRRIDDYAHAMGIEVVACIQTLGHLGQMLQWPRYAGLRDTNEVILSRAPETYALLEKLISTVTAPLRSRRIHIGMDEAYGVGEGRFRALYGAHEGTAVFAEHLAHVHAICQRLGLRAMMWSDMLFCLAAKNNALYAYYDQSNSAADALGVTGLPRDIDLVFWDYYHTQPDVYARKIQQHRALGCAHPWVAGAAWTWSRLWCHLPFSLESSRASLVAAKSREGRVASYMLTIWGDEGNECDFFSALPAMLYASHHAHTQCDEIAADLLADSFAAVCGGSLPDWMLPSRLDDIPSPAGDAAVRAQLPSNMSKWMLWEDPLLAFMSPQYAELALSQHFAHAADALLASALAAPSTASAAAASAAAVARPRYPLNRLLRLPGLLARVLSLKCDLRERLVLPYRAGDRAALLQVAETRLRPLIEAQRELWLYHRARWHRIYKPFGWETLELRYGGLSARLQTMYDRIVAYALRQPVAALRQSRAIGVAAGISRHPALLPPPSRKPSKCGDMLPPAPTSSGVAAAPLVPLVPTVPMPPPGPSMSAEEGSGLSVGAVPSWLPATAPIPVDAAAAAAAAAAQPPVAVSTAGVSSPGVEAPVTTVATTAVGLGWPVTIAATLAATTSAAVSPPHADANTGANANTNASANASASAVSLGAAESSMEPVMTTFPQGNAPTYAQPPPMDGGVMTTTINALGVRELGGEGDFWVQPAPLLPPVLDPMAGPPLGIGCLGEECDDDVIDSIPELEEDLHCIYENAYTSLLLDYGRVSAPSRLG
ncbi:hypothetical protein GGI07_004800 [Coemansia sp. Benny D115]|nr:hypothetical protein GGI07_004800 [Coemansia sp. Benny D115]